MLKKLKFQISFLFLLVFSLSASCIGNSNISNHAYKSNLALAIIKGNKISISSGKISEVTNGKGIAVDNGADVYIDGTKTTEKIEFVELDNGDVTVRRVVNRGKFTLKQIDEYVELATKQGNKSKVMLGKFDDGGSTSYVARAGVDHAYFDLGTTGWDNAMAVVGNDLDEMWRINKQFIDNRKALGNEFFLSHNPINPTGFYKREVEYLSKPISQGGLGGTIIDQGNNLWKVIW